MRALGVARAGVEVYAVRAVSPSALTDWANFTLRSLPQAPASTVYLSSGRLRDINLPNTI